MKKCLLPNLRQFQGRISASGKEIIITNPVAKHILGKSYYVKVQIYLDHVLSRI